MRAFASILLTTALSASLVVALPHGGLAESSETPSSEMTSDNDVIPSMTEAVDLSATMLAIPSTSIYLHIANGTLEAYSHPSLAAHKDEGEVGNGAYGGATPYSMKRGRSLWHKFKCWSNSCSREDESLGICSCRSL